MLVRGLMLIVFLSLYLFNGLIILDVFFGIMPFHLSVADMSFECTYKSVFLTKYIYIACRIA